MKKILLIGLGVIVLLVVALFLISNPKKIPVEPIAADEVAAQPLPGARSFFMGMTPWPYDFTDQALEETYQLLEEHTDLVVHHLDDGVPWNEALQNKPFPAKVEENIKTRVSHIKGNRPVYLAITPIHIDRDKMAGYWGEEANGPLPENWQNKPFDDPDVIDAYTNYCLTMIEKFNPDYLAYGIEVNLLASKDPEAYKSFVPFTKEVYRRLKQAHPALPIFLTIQIDTYHKEEEAAAQREAVEAILPYTDYIALTSYPYTESVDPNSLPDDWFSALHDLAPEKPFVIAETGFIAEDLDLWKYFVHIQGTERWQYDYLSKVLNDSQDLGAQFVVWFVPRDGDIAWEKLSKVGVDEFFKIYKDIGLIQGDGSPRASFVLWDRWMSLMHRRY